MTNTQRRYTSRSNRPKKDKLLNVLIGIVAVLIVITAGFIFIGNDDEEKEAANSEKNSEEIVSEDELETDEEQVEIGTEEIASEEENTEDEETAEETASEEETTTTEESPIGGTVTAAPTDDPLISDSIVNTEWKPIGTSQSGEHASIYSEGHVDWDEKVKALAYTTGLSTDNMIVWQIANGGGPQKSVGVVSSNDKEEKYRVYLQWVDGEGWKPEKMETLKTLDGAY